MTEWRNAWHSVQFIKAGELMQFFFLKNVFKHEEQVVHKITQTEFIPFADTRTQSYRHCCHMFFLT